PFGTATASRPRCGGHSSRPWVSETDQYWATPRAAWRLRRATPSKRATFSAVRREPYRGFGVAEKTWGRPALPSAAYSRRQADFCLRLSLTSSDEEVSNRLIIMAREYAAKADALAKEAAAAPPPAADPTALPDVGRDEAALSLAPNVPESPAEC